MSTWYHCHAHQLRYHEDHDGEYGGTCPMCNAEMLVAELKVVLMGLMSREWVQDRSDFESLRDRALAVLATVPGRRLVESNLSIEELVLSLEYQVERLKRTGEEAS